MSRRLPPTRAELSHGVAPGADGLRQIRGRHALAVLVPELSAEAARWCWGRRLTYRGLGTFAAEAARARDRPAVQGALVAALLLCAIIQTSAEAARRLLDPRPGPFQR